MFDEREYFKRQVLLVKLQADKPEIGLYPNFQESWEIIRGAFKEILKSAEKLPRVFHFQNYLDFSVSWIINYKTTNV